MAKKKADEVKKEPTVAQNFYSGVESYVPDESIDTEGKEKIVIGLIKAEKLQKAGWVLIDAHLTSDDPFSDKEYKFKRV